MILNNYYENNTKLFTKIIFQLIAVMIVLDLMWFLVMSSVWGKSVDNKYWKGQSSLQSFALILCWVQILLKGFTLFYLFVDFKEKNPNETNFLFNFIYKVTDAKPSTGSTDKGNQDWNKNPYDN